MLTSIVSHRRDEEKDEDEEIYVYQDMTGDDETKHAKNVLKHILVEDILKCKTFRCTQSSRQTDALETKNTHF